MKLTFDRAGVDRLIAHAKAAAEHFGQEPAKPGLWLVGDTGVYLMSNGKPGLLADASRQQFVVYADQINPLTIPFDDWRAAKEQAFGDDDGADTIDLDTLECSLMTYPEGESLMLELTPKSLTLIESRRTHKSSSTDLH